MDHVIKAQTFPQRVWNSEEIIWMIVGWWLVFAGRMIVGWSSRFQMGPPIWFFNDKTTRVQSAVFWCFNGSNLWSLISRPTSHMLNRLNFTNHGFVMGVLWSFNAFHGFSSGFSTVSIAIFGSKFQHQDHGGEIRSPRSHTMAPWWHLGISWVVYIPSNLAKSLKPGANLAEPLQARDESRLQLCAMWHCRTLGLIPCDTNWPGSQKMLVNALSIQDSRNKTNLRTSMFSRNSCWSTGW